MAKEGKPGEDPVPAVHTLFKVHSGEDMKRHSWTQKHLKTWPCLVAPIHIFSFSFPGS